MFAEFEDDIQFWGCNIPNEVKMVIDSANESVDKSFDNEDQKQAYHLGVENTLSVLKQLLDEGLSRDSITFYYPNAATTEEMDIEDINQWLETLSYNSAEEIETLMLGLADMLNKIRLEHNGKFPRW